MSEANCTRCGIPRPEHINHLWACCGDGPGYGDHIKPETVECLRRQLSAATARAEAAEAKVRDVETLDGQGCWEMDQHSSGWVTLGDDSINISGLRHATPTEARAAAAQWVRENSPPQKKPTDEGGRGEG